MSRGNFWACAIVAAALAGCGGQARDTFDLKADDPLRASLVATHGAINVAEPAAIGELATNRVVLRQGDGSLAVLSGSQWSDTLPRLVQDRMIVALEKAGYSASRPGARGGALIESELRRFEIDDARQLAVVEISARIGGSTRLLTGEAPAPQSAGAAGPQALRAALDGALVRLVGFVRGR